MDWQRIDVENDGSDAEARLEPAPHTGLEARPEALHERFMSDLGNLQQVHDEHQHALGRNFGSVEQNFERVAGVLRTEAMLDRYGGRSDDGLLILPLHGCELSGVTLDITEVEGQTVIRLNLMGNEGGELEQAFTLPVGSGLESATWSAGELHLRLN